MTNTEKTLRASSLPWRLFLLAVELLCCSVFLCGQIVNAKLFGPVTDTTGAAVPGAIVIVTNVDTSIATKAATDEAGNYVFLNLPPGRYTIKVNKPGFASTVISGITLLVNQRAEVPVELRVGEVTTTVQVNGAAPLVDTTTASVGTVVGKQMVVDLPLNLRRFGALATLVPGTVSDNGGGASSLYYTTFSEQTYIANGARDASNLVLIDGVDSRNWGGGGFSLQPPPDAVEEFKLQTNNYSAAFGVAAGSVINLVTKSGTNRLHGTVYEFLRNDEMDARNFFATNQTNPVTGAELPGSARPEYRRNQFGFAVGGPIKKDKTFWFVNYEGLREIQGLTLTAEMPTDAQKSGNFSSLLTGQTLNLCGAGGPANLNFDAAQLFNPATESLYTCPPGSAKAGSTILAGQPIPGNLITTIDPVARKMLGYFAEPNRPGYPSFVNQQPQVRQDNQFDVRIDHTFGPKDQFFGRYLFGQSNIISPTLGNIEPGFGGTVYNRAQNLALGWTHTFSPSLLNEAHFGFQREYDIVNCQKCPYPSGTLASFGIQGLTALSPLFEEVPNFTFVNYPALGDSGYNPDIVPDMAEKYQDNLTWNHGRHSVAVGADMLFTQVFRWTAASALNGQISFDGAYSSLGGEIPDVTGVSDLADFLLGYPSYGLRNYNRYLGTNLTGLDTWSYYGQDDVKLRSNLALNMGLRWEYRRPPIDKRNNMVAFAPLKPPFSGPGDAILVTAADDTLNDSFCSDPTINVTTPDGRCLVATSAQRAQLGFTGRTRRSLIFPQWGDFAPRLGSSWRPLSSNKLIVRTGYGIFYDLPETNGNASPVSPVFAPVQDFTPAFGSPPQALNGTPITAARTFVAAGIPPVDQSQIITSAVPNFQVARVQEWSFGVESELAQNWALEVDYIGNSASHLGNIHLYANQPLPGVGELQPRRPYPDFNQLVYITSDANSNYNSLQAKLTKRLSSGFTFLTSYTWGHGLSDDEGDEGSGGGVGNFGAQNDNDQRAEYANTYVDARQRLVFSYVWQLPFGSGHRFLYRPGVINRALGGWSFSGIASFQSGFPFSVISSEDYSNTGSINPRPDRLCNGAGQKTVNDWFDTSCFTTGGLEQALAAGHPRFGNSGRNVLVGPGLNDWDLALVKEFALTERFKLQFRAESYNATNTAPFSAPNPIVGSPFIGQIGSAGAAREIQLALKLSF